MPKIIMEDDCLAPAEKIELEYAGPNPFKAYLITKRTLQQVFEIKTKDIWEREFRWDYTGDPRGFFIRIFARKKMDKNTYVFSEIIFQGKQPTDPKKPGSLKMKIGGYVKTTFPQDTIFQKTLYRMFIWIYHRLIYFKQRRYYLDYCKERLEKLKSIYMELLNIKPP
jgi:hypothetical protein